MDSVAPESPQAISGASHGHAGTAMNDG